MEKKFKLFGYVLFSILIVLSFYFYRERILVSDSVFQFFKILNFEKFNIESSRYGVVISQIPLLITIKLNLTENVKILAVVYSLSFILLYFSLYVLLDRGFKDTSLSIALLSVLIIGISRSFYHTVTETHQSLMYVVTLYAVYKHNFKNEIFNYVLPLVFCGLSFYSHMVAIIIIPFILVFYHIHYKQAINLKLVFVLFSIVALLIAKLFLFKTTSYEHSFLEQIYDFKTTISSFRDWYSFKFFNIHLPDVYIFELLLFVYSIIYLSKNKKHKELVFLIISTITIFFLLAIIYNKTDSGTMMERAFMPLTVIICIPFFTYIFENYKEKNVIQIVTRIILVISIIRISYTGYECKQRSLKVDKLIEYAKNHSNQDKFIVSDEMLTKDFSLSPSIHYWAYSFETLFVSLIEDENRQITIFATDLQDVSELTEKPDIFLSMPSWMIWKNEVMNKKYYNVKAEYYEQLE